MSLKLAVAKQVSVKRLELFKFRQGSGMHCGAPHVSLSRGPCTHVLLQADPEKEQLELLSFETRDSQVYLGECRQVGFI